MKKISLLLITACFSLCSVYAQLPDVTKAIPASFDVKGITGSVMGILGPKLKLTSEQSSGVTEIVSSFLGSKANILPLSQTNPSEYASKLSGLTGTMNTKLDGILDDKQMAKFQGLKPKTNDPSNVLSNLFY